MSGSEPDAFGSEDTSDLAQVFGALANSDRIAILSTLRRSQTTNPQGLSISEIADATELSRFSASRHLKILVEVDLVEARSVRQALLHRLRRTGFDRVDDWLCAELESDWSDLA